MSVNYETVPAPNYAAYANPGFGAALGQMLQGLPGQYMQGREMARTREMQDAFKDGIPLNSDRSPNVNAIITKGAQIGGLPFVQQMLPFLQQVALGDQAAGDLAGAGGGGSAPARPNSPNAAGPSNITAPATRTSSNGSDVGDGPGSATLRSMATEFAGGDRDATGLISGAARSLRINPDAPLSSDQAAQVKTFLSQSPKPFATSADITPPSGSASAAERASNGPDDAGGTAQNGPGGRAAAPFAASGASGAPGPQAESTGAAPSTSGLPQGYDEATAGRLEQAAQNLRAKAARYAALKNPELSQSFEKQAEAYDARAKGIREALAKNAEFTPEQKNARDKSVEGFQTRKEVVAGDIKTSEKLYQGLQTLGQVGQVGNQKLDRIRSIMSDPNFMSGAGNQIALAWKQWNATLGGDPKAAAPMEEFNKTAQQLLTDDIKAMGQSGAGPVRVAEVQIMKQATANLGISPATNRYLVEEAYRVHNDNIAVARLAQQYKQQQHGYLDAGWDAIRDKYYQEHPLFTKEELADPRLVAPPYLPKDVAADPAKHAQWVRAQGIKPGDPIKTDDPKRPIVWAK
jgi:hypothetical protein